MRKLFISADMEGAGAVASPSALLPDRWEWAAARRWMTEEVVAASRAAFAAGYDEVIVADSHGNAQNVDPDLLPDGVRIVRSWPRPLMMMQGVEDPEVEACAFIGYHAGSTTPNSLLAHSFHGGVCRKVTLNGELCSEGYFNAALGGEFGRPVVFVSGDEHTIADVRRYAPQAVGFVTKHSIGYRSQVSAPPAQVCRMLQKSVAEALARPSPPPFVIKGPLHLEVELTSHLAAEMLAYLPGVKRLDAWTVAVTCDRMEAAVRWLTFITSYSPTGVVGY